MDFKTEWAMLVTKMVNFLLKLNHFLEKYFYFNHLAWADIIRKIFNCNLKKKIEKILNL